MPGKLTGLMGLVLGVRLRRGHVTAHGGEERRLTGSAKALRGTSAPAPGGLVPDEAVTGAVRKTG